MKFNGSLCNVLHLSSRQWIFVIPSLMVYHGAHYFNFLYTYWNNIGFILIYIFGPNFSWFVSINLSLVLRGKLWHGYANASLFKWSSGWTLIEPYGLHKFARMPYKPTLFISHIWDIILVEHICDILLLMLNIGLFKYCTIS